MIGVGAGIFFGLTQAELAVVRAVSEDLPALWHADTTTQAERQTIVRLLLERLVVEVIGDSEQVRVECHWCGGSRTEHRIVRPVSCAKRPSTYPALVTRASELRDAGLDGTEIAEILNREGWRPTKRCDAFSGSMVRNLLHAAHPEAPVSQLRHPAVEREPDEWTVPELARCEFSLNPGFAVFSSECSLNPGRAVSISIMM